MKKKLFCFFSFLFVLLLITDFSIYQVKTDSMENAINEKHRRRC